MNTPLEPGRLITPSVRLVRQIGAGGMGTLWVADHLTLHSQVAVKFIAQGLATDGAVVERFSREAAAASTVKSQHVVQMFDRGVTEDGIPFIVMELLEGRDLADYLEANGPMSVEHVGQVVLQVTKALRRAHKKGIVHRDIKPHNIFLCESDGADIFVKLLDFGIAKGQNQVTSATLTGSTMGSPHYMSPEQVVDSKGIDHRADLWSLGVVAFEALTNRQCFDGETIGAIHIAIHGGPIPKPSDFRADLPPAVDAWFKKACTRDRNGRFQDASEMGDAVGPAFFGESASITGRRTPLEIGRSSGDASIRSHGAASDRTTPSGAPGPMRKPGHQGSSDVGLAVDATQVAPGTPARISELQVPAQAAANASTGSTPSVATSPKSPDAARGKTPMLVVLGVLAVAAGALLLARGRHDPPATVTAASQTAATTASAGSTAAPAASTAPTAAVVAVATANPNAVAQTQLKISAQTDARLFLDGVALASNPFSGSYPQDGQTHKIRAELAGYVPQTSDVVFDRGLVEINLVALVREKPKVAGAVGTFAPPTATAKVTAPTATATAVPTATPTTTASATNTKLAPIDRENPFGK